MPAWLLPAILAAGQALAAAAESRGRTASAEEDRAAAKEVAALNNAADWERALLDTATTESALDPFRHQTSQARTLAALDQLERGQYTPAQLDVRGSPYAGYVPTLRGGYSYEPSPVLRQAAGALMTNVLAGQTAPTMTDAANYGRTGAVDLLAVLAGQTPAWQATAPSRPVRGARGVAVGGGRARADEDWRRRRAAPQPEWGA
jgi:hypothetical protein